MLPRCPRKRSHDPGRRDVVRRRLAPSLEQQREPTKVLPVPGRERRQPFEPVALGHDDHFDVRAVLGRRDVARFAAVESVRRQFVAGRRDEAELAAVLRDRVRAWVEVDRAREGRRDDQLGAADERQRVAVGVVATGEVAVERRDDRVLLVALDVFALPLADARSAGVRQHRRAGLLEGGQLTVALGRRANLFRAGRHQQRRAQLQPRLGGLTRDVRRAADVLVGRVGARADQRVGHLFRVRLRGHEIANFGDAVAQVRRVRADPGRLQRREVDLEHAVEDLVAGVLDRRRRRAGAPRGRGPAVRSRSAPCSRGRQPCACRRGTAMSSRRSPRPCS